MKIPAIPPDRMAEELGYMAREFGDPREANPYLEHRKPSGPDDSCDPLIVAWYRGWDLADKMLRGE